MQEKIRILRPVSLLVQIGGMKERKKKKVQTHFRFPAFRKRENEKMGGNNRKR